MNTFSGIDYIKIDVANSLGKDKLNFEDRIEWFNNNIPESVVTMDNQELLTFVMGMPEPDSIELAYAGLLAYQDYWFKRPSGYMCQLDAVSSGISLMSCLTADIKGLENTGLIGNKRADLYSAVYKTFTKLYGKETNKTRADVKQACMTFSYGSRKVPKEVFGETEEMFNCFYDAMNQECNGAVQLQELLITNWNPNTDNHCWVLPDGFTAYIPVIVEKQFEYQLDEETVVPYSIKMKGTKKSSVANAPNLIHSCDSLIIREMARRCMFDRYQVELALYSLYKANNDMPNSKADTSLVQESVLTQLIDLYEQSKFCSVRIVEYLTTAYTAYLMSQQHRDKLISIIEAMLKHDYIEMVAIHDCVKAKPNKMNYIRYWYKEICADIVESNMLSFLYNQIWEEDQIVDPLTAKYRKEVANKVRQSSYGLC